MALKMHVIFSTKINLFSEILAQYLFSVGRILGGSIRKNGKFNHVCVNRASFFLMESAKSHVLNTMNQTVVFKEKQHIHWRHQKRSWTSKIVESVVYLIFVCVSPNGILKMWFSLLRFSKDTMYYSELNHLILQTAYGYFTPSFALFTGRQKRWLTAATGEGVVV